MRLTEAFFGTGITEAERGTPEVWVIIHRSRSGFQLSRYVTRQEQRTSQFWTFPNLYDLLLFARDQGFAEVDPEAEDWQPIFGGS